MKLKRARVIAIMVITTSFALLGIVYYRATIPFHTAQQFLKLVYSHRLDEAKQMLDQDDLDKLPPKYWDRLEQTELRDDHGWSFSYTTSSLLDSTITFWINVPDGDDGMKDSSVLFNATGRKIKIRKTEFSLTPRSLL